MQLPPGTNRAGQRKLLRPVNLLSMDYTEARFINPSFLCIFALRVLVNSSEVHSLAVGGTRHQVENSRRNEVSGSPDHGGIVRARELAGCEP
jgi:hypothetical protein